ncbi:acyl-CoA dehydrogenase [Desulfatitalea tepidiphila]|uniref:acyl-CoA dehydrogenase n=1 Tax=Desulfatitalea tepidiphila TaxID=1185843 RepID=UPI0006B452C2|nr:acyl-CoA dehydrogenase [Desulfatitalea tepidiphila]
MGHFKVNTKDLMFILKEQLHYGRLCELERYQDQSEKVLDLMVKEAVEFAKGVVDPLNEIGETVGLRFENNQVICPPEFRKAFKQYGEDGWTAAARDLEYGGQGFPHMMRIVVNDLMYGACQSFNMAPSLTHGAAHLVESFGTRELKETYVPKMFDGTWAGTMCLTEPNAGSNLAALETMAYPEDDHYKIKGNKIFISWGEHDLADNIIHLVLARIEGEPEGIKGISLFVVPKVRVNSDGSLGEPNDVVCTGIEEKLGLHASATAALTFGGRDGCIGYLCGEKNKGLAHMFQMMNQARINTGVSGMAMASTAYLNALAYTKEREQGRDIADRTPGQVKIIQHPDVRRMLLWMKATVDGMRSMIYTGAFWSDLALELPDGEERTHYQNLIDFMTPIIKAYCSDMGFRVCETAMQCYGGYGYCRDYPIEQYLRDAKIMSLYEGTNGIQSIDLMGRKMSMRNGACLNAFKKEIENFCDANREHPEIGDRVRALYGVFQRLMEVADEMKQRMQSDPLQWASYTYPGLIAFGEVIMCWRLLDMAVIAAEAIKKKKTDFYLGKIYQATFFTDMTLPQTLATLETCLRPGREIVEIPDAAF